MAREWGMVLAARSAETRSQQVTWHLPTERLTLSRKSWHLLLLLLSQPLLLPLPFPLLLYLSDLLPLPLPLLVLLFLPLTQILP